MHGGDRPNVINTSPTVSIIKKNVSNHIPSKHNKRKNFFYFYIYRLL